MEDATNVTVEATFKVATGFKMEVELTSMPSLEKVRKEAIALLKNENAAQKLHVRLPQIRIVRD